MAKGFTHIDSMFAYVVLDLEDNTEGVVSFMDPATGQNFPLVGANTERAEQYRPIAEHLAAVLRTPVHLVHFTNRTLVETIGVPDVADE